MINGKPTWLDLLLEAIESQIAASGVVARDAVWSTEASDADLIEAPARDRFVAVTPAAFPVAQGIVMGGMRQNTGFDGRVAVRAFARHQSDQEFRSGRAMKGTDGTLALTLSLLASLQGFMPVDGQGNGLLRESMRLINFDLTPRRIKADGQSTPWSVISSVWEMKFTADISGAAGPLNQRNQRTRF